MFPAVVSIELLAMCVTFKCAYSLTVQKVLYLCNQWFIWECASATDASYRFQLVSMAHTQVILYVCSEHSVPDSLLGPGVYMQS